MANNCMHNLYESEQHSCYIVCPCRRTLGKSAWLKVLGERGGGLCLQQVGLGGKVEGKPIFVYAREDLAKHNSAFTGTKAVKEGPKNEWRGGYYFPLTAVQVYKVSSVA